MLKTFDKIYLIGTPKRIVLMLFFFLYGLISASGQRLSNYKIIELINNNRLQMDIQVVADMSDNKLDNWIMLEGSAIFVLQSGDRNLALIDQLKGAGNLATTLQHGYNNRSGFEYADYKECVIFQFGSNNYTEVQQFGNQNRSQAFQYGDSNEIGIVQHGRPSFIINALCCSQKTIVLQTGNGNYATVTQISYP